MTSIAILKEETGAGNVTYRAVAHRGAAQSVGRTAGEALDALTCQLPREEAGTIVVIQEMAPDRYSTAEQIQRLNELTERANQGTLSQEEQFERQQLIETEILASGQRAAALADMLGL